MKISFVFPALNEEEGIGNALNEIPISHLKKLGHETEVIVVDGGSTDRTAEIAKMYGAKVILSKRGYGRQYKVGFKAASGDIIVTGDSDGSYPFSSAPALVEKLLREELDFINTNRFRNLEPGAMSIQHHFGNIVLTVVTNILFGLNLKDSQSGMWVFRRRILESLTLISDGMPMSEELKIEAFKKFKAAETPIIYRKRVGKVKLNTIRDGLANFSFLFYKRLLFK